MTIEYHETITPKDAPPGIYAITDSEMATHDLLIKTHADHWVNFEGTDYGTDADRHHMVTRVTIATRPPEMPGKDDPMPYGIIDPDYARAYTVIRKLAWEEGYSIGLHGSFTKDLDLVASPWTDRAGDPEHLVGRIVASHLRLCKSSNDPGIKPHGRKVWTLVLPEFGDPRYIDLSIFPPLPTESK